MEPSDATKRLSVRKQTLDDAYASPANFLEIDVINPITHGDLSKRYTDYEVRMRTNLPVFKLKESSVRRRYSDFEWLRSELERDSKIVVPPLPGKAWTRQLPFRGDEGIFDEEFIENRKQGLEIFINKIAGHPLAQNERCLHMFLQEPVIDRNYVPGKIHITCICCVVCKREMHCPTVLRASRTLSMAVSCHRACIARSMSSVHSVLSDSNPTMKKYVPRRAILYVPGHDMRKIKKIPSAGADCVILDCEDGVALTRKDEARKTIHGVLENLEIPFGRTECCVRVNSVQSGLCEDDMVMVCSLRNLPKTLMLPKVDNVEQLRFFAYTLRTRLDTRKIPTKLGLVMFIESANGVLRLRHLVEEAVRLSHNSPFNVEGLVFGSDDLCADIGADRSKEADEVIYARQHILLVAKSFGLQAIDVVYIDYKDSEGLKRQAEQGARWGFTGKQVIHPDQVPIVQAAFTPSPEKIKFARGLIAAFEESQSSGVGAFNYQDKMIDRPLLLQAKNIVQLADAIGSLRRETMRWLSVCETRRALCWCKSRGFASKAEEEPRPGRMRAWQIHDYSGIEALTLSQNARIPVLSSPTDLLIEVHAASVNPVDVRMISGYGSQILNSMRKASKLQPSLVEFPIIPGRDFAGVVVDAGKLTRGFKPGDRVYGCPAPHCQGSHANYVVAPSITVQTMPKNLSFVEAAALPYAFMTMYSALRLFGDYWIRKPSEERVLVVGASGGIGTLAVQTLKAWGSEVAAVCRTDAMELVERLGADEVYDYTQPSWMDSASSNGLFDLVLDCATSGSSAGHIELSKLVKKWKFGRYVTLTPPVLSETDTRGIIRGALRSGTLFADSNIRSLFDGGRSVRWAFFVPHPKALTELNLLLNRGQIKPILDQVYPFSQLPEAYANVKEGSNRGKIVLSILDDAESVEEVDDRNSVGNGANEENWKNPVRVVGAFTGETLSAAVEKTQEIIQKGPIAAGDLLALKCFIFMINDDQEKATSQLKIKTDVQYPGDPKDRCNKHKQRCRKRVIVTVCALAFDDIQSRVDAVSHENCDFLHLTELFLPDESVSHKPDVKDININPTFPNRTAMLYLHNLALSRGFYFSYILQKAWDSDEPGVMYHYLSVISDVTSSPKLNASATYFAPNSSYSPSYRGFFNKTMPLFAPRAFRADDYNDPIHLERVSTLNTIVAMDLGPDETPGPVKWVRPYFDCGRSNKWIFGASVPIADIYPRHTSFRHIEYPTFTAVSVMEMDFDRIDINQCPLGKGNPGPNVFAGTDFCKKETTEIKLIYPIFALL
ncbi:unnamed protein product [Notodromas monacha]|uniref:Citramalyl-CoA lyase, mitochondrial n=1 Tax=Notodromas monacha TaxID=399045 RepID=A0A7R9BS93_9CRUS|nr:unnamed protein product [Notodromas monacha]CAG0920746.1 unnamed protein product [Notodromas monacha]